VNGLPKPDSCCLQQVAVVSVGEKESSADLADKRFVQLEQRSLSVAVPELSASQKQALTDRAWPRSVGGLAGAWWLGARVGPHRRARDLWLGPD
jgi:hypothetical protein